MAKRNRKRKKEKKERKRERKREREREFVTKPLRGSVGECSVSNYHHNYSSWH